MRKADERAARKVAEGLSFLEEGRMTDAEGAFRSADTAGGLALVAFHQTRYERAANKALQALARLETSPTAPEDGCVALWILRRSRDRLPTPNADPRVGEREERVIARADAFLSIVPRTLWNEQRELLRERAQEWPTALGPLCEARTGKAMHARRTVSAFHLILERYDLHGAAELLRRADMACGIRRALPSLALCPGCLVRHMAPDKSDTEDPWWFRRLVRGEAAELRLDTGSTREEALLLGLAILHLVRAPGFPESGTPRLLGLAEEALTSCPTRPTIRKSGTPVSDLDLKSAVETLLAAVAKARGKEEEAREHWERASRLGFSFWSTEAQRALEEHGEARKVREDLLDGARLLREAEQARHQGDEEREWAALVGLGERKELDTALSARKAILAVVTGHAAEPETFREALRAAPDDPRVRSRTLVMARDSVDQRTALRLLRALGPVKNLDAEDLSRYARLAEEQEMAATAAKAFEALAARDCSYLTKAAHLLHQVGEEERARNLLRRGCLPGCPSVEHRSEACRESEGWSDLELQKVVARAFLWVAPDNPEAVAFLHTIEGIERQRQEAWMTQAKADARTAAGNNAWATVTATLERLPFSSLDGEFLLLLARAYEFLGRWTDAAEWHERRGEGEDPFLASARCRLRANQVEATLDLLRRLRKFQDLSEGAEETPSWLAKTLQDRDPDLGSLALAVVGRTREAAQRAIRPEVLSLVAREAQRTGQPQAELVARARLSSLRPPTEEERRRLGDLERAAPISEKAGLPFPETKRLVLLDTNVLVSLLLREVGDEGGLKLEARPHMVEAFDRLPSVRSVGVVPAVVRGEFLALVSDPTNANGEEEAGENLLRSAERLLEELDLDRRVGEPVRAGEKHLERARAFFRGQARHLAHLTRAKIEEHPERAEEILRKRRGDRHVGGESVGEALPESGDIWLLAQALRLREMVVPGIASVGILSDDRDFRDFRDALKRDLGVETL